MHNNTGPLSRLSLVLIFFLGLCDLSYILFLEYGFGSCNLFRPKFVAVSSENPKQTQTLEAKMLFCICKRRVKKIWNFNKQNK